MKLFLSILLALVIATSGYCEEIARIVAKVNNQVITTKDLRDYTKMVIYRLAGTTAQAETPDFEKTARESLNRLIDDRLVLDKAISDGIPIHEAQIDAKLDQMISFYPSRQAFEESLIQDGLTLSMIRNRIKEQFLLQQAIEMHVDSQISVLPWEINEYYDSHRSEFRAPVSYVLWVTKADDPKVVSGLKQAISSGGIDAAKKEYPNILNKIKVFKGEMRPEIEKKISRIQEGKYSIVDIDGKKFVYMEKKIPPRDLTLEESKEAIYNFLKTQKFQEKFNEWLNELKEEAVIKVYIQ